MKRFAHLIRPAALVLLVLSATTIVLAQDAERQQLKAAIDQHRSHIRIADSTGDAREAARQRIMLAPLVKASEARKLYGEAAVIADSVGLVEDEELRARQGLMDLYRAKGNWRAAYEESAKVIELTALWQQRQAFLALEEEAASGQRSVEQRDSLLSELAVVRSDASQQLEAVREQKEAWKWALVTAVLIGSLVLVVMLWSGRRSQRRMRDDIEALRAELALQRAQPGNRMRERPSGLAEELPRSAHVDRPVERSIARGADPMVLEIFRSMAPERLRTLQQARAEGDADKVVRVVHTLKPQLTAIDEGRFSPLCASLTTPHASMAHARWNADLDQLEQAIKERLG